jgi:hypothetical protein
VVEILRIVELKRSEIGIEEHIRKRITTFNKRSKGGIEAFKG